MAVTSSGNHAEKNFQTLLKNLSPNVRKKNNINEVVPKIRSCIRQ